jgi:hypothetical protein
MKQQLRALSHDMSANFMVLEHSFQLLKEHVQDQHAPNLSEGANHLEACLQESRRLLSDLHSLAKTGSIPVAPERVALSATIQQVVYEQEDVLGERRSRVVVEPELPVVWCNEQRARQMITNLVRSAALHGCDPENGRILISRRPGHSERGARRYISTGRASGRHVGRGQWPGTGDRPPDGGALWRPCLRRPDDRPWNFVRSKITGRERSVRRSRFPDIAAILTFLVDGLWNGSAQRSSFSRTTDDGPKTRGTRHRCLQLKCYRSVAQSRPTTAAFTRGDPTTIMGEIGNSFLINELQPIIQIGATAGSRHT